MSWKAVTALYKARSNLSYLSYVHLLMFSLQLTKHQLDKNIKLVDMVGKMKRTLEFSREAHELETYSRFLRPVVKDLLSNIVKCSRFVQKYTRKSAVGP